MYLLWIIFLLEIIILVQHSCSDIQGELGVLIGTWNPASFLTLTSVANNSNTKFYYKLERPSEQITSITSDPSRAVVFAAISDTIYMYPNFSLVQNGSESLVPIFKGKSYTFGQIAFDYVSSNLYWCDALHYWIAMKPAYNLNNSIYKIVVHKDLKQPEGLALDPEDRFMFFSDNGPNPRIERAYLDGQDREVIVYSGLSRVFSLSVDVLNDRLYWVDKRRHTVEVCNYDRSNRRVIRRMDGVQLTDLFFHQNYLHTVSPGNKVLFIIDASSGLEVYSGRTSEEPFTVHIYNSKTHRSPQDPCTRLTCEHICVNTKSGPECLCSEGYNIAEDGKSCTERSWFFQRGFIVSNGTLFAMHEIHSSSGQRRGLQAWLIRSNIIETFAVNSKLDIIYFINSRSNSLRQFDLISSHLSTLTTVSSGKGLVFDWIANLLGWIEAESSIIAYSINSRKTATIYTNLTKLDWLTVDTYKGVLYWISGLPGSRSVIRGTWSRDPPRVLISEANFHSPSSLQYDVSSNRLYWMDQFVIKSSTTNGSDIKIHVITIGATLAFVYKEYFGWIKGDKINFARRSSTSAEVISETVSNITNVAVFDASLQQDKRGSCQVLNGGCEEICIPITNGRRCECDIGLKLQADNTCDSDQLMENFIIVTDVSHQRLLQINLKNGSIVKLPITATAPGIAFDKVTKTLFYSDIKRKTIMSTTLHGHNSSLIYTTGFAYADRFAIDYSTGNLYYTAKGSNLSRDYIGVVHRSLLLHKVLLSNLNSPMEIVLYPSKGFLFWVEYGNKTQICRTHMDGSARLFIATTNLGLPTGLAIDLAGSRLYWADSKTNHIEFSDLNGGSRQILATDYDAHLMSIGIQGQYLYYTAWNRQGITKMDKTTGSKIPFMSNHPELGRLDSIDIYADDVHDVSISCSNKNGMCSTFCFPTPTGRTCGCEDNVNLQPDQMTCDEDTEQLENEVSEGNNTSLYVGASSSGVGVIVVLVVVVSIICRQTKRQKRREAQYEHNLSIENPYSVIGNNGNTMRDDTGYIEVIDDDYHELSSIGDPETKYNDTVNNMYLTVTT